MTSLRLAVALALLATIGACGEPDVPEPVDSVILADPVPYDAEEAAAYAARTDALRSITCGDRGGELREEIPERLDVTFDTPEAAWAYVTDPSTPLPQRLRAAIDAAQIIPYSWLPRVAAARKHVRAEQRLHQWGRRGNPTGAWRLDEPRAWHRVKELLRTMPDAERRREIVGHEWTVPREPQGFLPLTWKERCEGLWPVQVDAALEMLLRAWAPHVHHKGRLAWSPELVDEWMQQVLALPMEDVDDVWLVHELAIQWTDSPDIRVLARFHDIIRDPRFAEASGHLAESIVNNAVRFRDPDAGLVCQVLVLDFWESEQPEDGRQRAGYTLRSIAEARHSAVVGRTDQPWPATVMLEACRRGLDPDVDDAWSRLYCYLFSVCEAHPDPPFSPNRHEDPDNAQHWIDLFAAWFEENEDALEDAADAEADDLKRVRRRLVNAQK